MPRRYNSGKDTIGAKDDAHMLTNEEAAMDASGV